MGASMIQARRYPAESGFKASAPPAFGINKHHKATDPMVENSSFMVIRRYWAFSQEPSRRPSAVRSRCKDRPECPRALAPSAAHRAAAWAKLPGSRILWLVWRLDH